MQEVTKFQADNGKSFDNPFDAHCEDLRDRLANLIASEAATSRVMSDIAGNIEIYHDIISAMFIARTTPPLDLSMIAKMQGIRNNNEMPIDDIAKNGEIYIVVKGNDYATALWTGKFWSYPDIPQEIDFEPTHYIPRE